MSEQPDFAVSAELKSWLFSAIAESMLKAIAAYHKQAKPVSKSNAALNVSDSEESHNDSDNAPRKRPWKGNSASAGKGKAPAKNPRLSLPSSSLPILDPLEGSTSHDLQVVNEYCTGLL
ncbi:Hypothetical predicted protein [Pelobates cultripes]|uniref:Uncharacterized protein n=1 Tax=Pelobates cultripes TaxID=61616 RepID=A0AAD1TH41_PELCU|nr:Hypothetical predicted protein [Pelobates cultripes]